MSKMDRRQFLKTTGAGALVLGGGFLLPSPLLRSTAWAQDGDDTVLVVIFQRGAMDGLAAVAPLDDPYYHEHRPRIALRADKGDARERLLRLGDSGYGLHPSMGALAPLYEQGQLAIVHGAGSPNPTRSHFDAQDFMETGTPFRKGTASGWMNRALGQLPGHGPFRAVAFSSDPPRSLAGVEPSLALEDLRAFSQRGSRLEDQLRRCEAAAHPLLREAALESREAMQTLQRFDARGYQPDVEYPAGRLGGALAQVAFLVKANTGIRLAFAESEGWDTHVQQGAAFGQFANRGREFAGALAAFREDLGEHGQRVILLTMTEFGRTVAENGSRGTDHGRGSCFFVMGERVQGGQVLGGIPTLRESNLEDGRDLPVVVDYREILDELIVKHLGLHGEIFPGYRGRSLGLMS